MYKIRGMYEAICRNLPIVLSSTDQAKAKLLYGSTCRNVSFSDMLYQFDSRLDFDKGNDFFVFNYIVPYLSVLEMLYEVTHINDSRLDIDHIVDNTYLYSCTWDTYDRVEDVVDGYNAFLSELSDMIAEEVNAGKLIYKGESLNVYYVILSKHSDGIIGLRGSEILFVFRLDLSIIDSDMYKGADFKSLEDSYLMIFKFNTDYEYSCYISKSDYRLLKGEVRESCIG